MKNGKFWLAVMGADGESGRAHLAAARTAQQREEQLIESLADSIVAAILARA